MQDIAKLNLLENEFHMSVGPNEGRIGLPYPNSSIHHGICSFVLEKCLYYSRTGSVSDMNITVISDL
jgi:hypothetical protein